MVDRRSVEPAPLAVRSLLPIVVDSASVELLISAKCDFMQVIDAPRHMLAELFARA